MYGACCAAHAPLRRAIAPCGCAAPHCACKACCAALGCAALPHHAVDQLLERRQLPLVNQVELLQARAGAEDQEQHARQPHVGACLSNACKNKPLESTLALKDPPSCRCMKWRRPVCGCGSSSSRSICLRGGKHGTNWVGRVGDWSRGLQGSHQHGAVGMQAILMLQHSIRQTIDIHSHADCACLPKVRMTVAMRQRQHSDNIASAHPPPQGNIKE